MTLFAPRPGVPWRNDITQSITVGGNKHFRGENPAPGTAISYYLKSAPAGDVKITITDVTGTVVREIAGTKDAGLNRVQWNLRGNPAQGGAGGRARVAAGGGWRRRRGGLRRRAGRRAGHLPGEAHGRREGLHAEDRGGGGHVLSGLGVEDARG